MISRFAHSQTGECAVAVSLSCGQDLVESRSNSSARSMLARRSVLLTGFLDEIRGARLHRLDRHPHITIAGNHDRRKPVARARNRCRTSRPLIPGIVASTSTQPSPPDERHRRTPYRRISLDPPSLFLKYGADRVAHAAVVIDD